MWLTPSVCGNYNRKGRARRAATGLQQRSGDGRRRGQPTGTVPECTAGGADYRMSGEHQIQLQTQVGGQLNPEFVEWLMGYRLETTELEPLAIAWFRSARKKHLNALRGSNEKRTN
jgi:hypothetical protein